LHEFDLVLTNVFYEGYQPCWEIFDVKITQTFIDIVQFLSEQGYHHVEFVDGFEGFFFESFVILLLRRHFFILYSV